MDTINTTGNLPMAKENPPYHLSLTEYSGESWDQMGYPNSPAGNWGDQGSSILTSEYFDTHNIWIRRLLAKTVMLVNEDLTGNFKDPW